MFLLAKPETKILLLSILMFKLNHKNWERIADGEEGEQDKHFAQFVIMSLQKSGTFFSDLILGSRHV